MSQHIEIEFKNLLTNKEFLQLKRFFQLKDSDFIKQENHYFDTKAFSLKKLGTALRIRQKKGRYELTLKQPAEDGLLETNQNISLEEANEMIRSGFLTNGVVKKQMDQLKVNQQELEYFGSLTTERAEIEYREGLLVLDYSYYLNNEDYELEYEVCNIQLGKAIFQELLQQHSIPFRKTESKIQRFYSQKYKLD